MRKSPYSKNRKKRRLEYIRFKNKIRNFDRVGFTTKLSKHELDENEMIEHLIKIDSVYFKNEILRKYKIEVHLIDLTFGYVNYDFIEEMVTVKFTYKRLKANELKKDIIPTIFYDMN